MAGAGPDSSEGSAGCWDIRSRNRGNLPGATEEPAASNFPVGHWYMGHSWWGKAEKQWSGSAAPVVVGSSVLLHPLDLPPPQPRAVLCFCQHSGLATAQNIFFPILLRAAHSLRMILLCGPYQEAAGFPSCQAGFFITCISPWLEKTHILSLDCVRINYP